jgi:predicted transcriptional regulator
MTPNRHEPTDREMAILKILWRREEATVREVYQALREEIPIVQNTVQAFLRIMEDKGLVTHRTRGRSFVYRPTLEEGHLEGRLVDGLLRRVFDGALDQLVERALSVKPPTEEEIRRLRELLDAHSPAPKGRRPR